MKSTKKHRIPLRRVDVQVSLFTACAVVISCFCIFAVGYNATYRDMLMALEERVYSIYNFLEVELDKTTFIDVNSAEDMNKSSYLAMKNLFKSIKNTTGVQYLYTAKRNANGQLIYVIDGLDSNAEDFRPPGSLIEDEIVADLNRALDGETIMPNVIKKTTWGDIFITYLPIHNNQGDVVGAIGIEFHADHQYETYHILRIAGPTIIFLACILCALFSIYFFRRISNPHYQDMANTDYLTGLKNRNAYEVDTQNMCAIGTAAGIGMLVADLNGLKQVNDHMGHDMGDLYIQAFAKSLQAAQTGREILYRVGGDEFVTIFPSSTAESIDNFVELANAEFSLRVASQIPIASCSFGYAFCADNQPASLEAAYREADAAMFVRKNAFYQAKRSKKNPS